MVEVDVYDVHVPNREDETPPEVQAVVVLKEKDGERLLPIWIGEGEGTAIALQNRVVAHADCRRSIVTVRVSRHARQIDACGRIGLPSKNRLSLSSEISIPEFLPVNIPAMALPAPGPMPNPWPLNPVAT